MKDSQLKIKIQEMQATAFKRLQLALSCSPKDAGYTSISAMLEAMLRESIKKIDKFVESNIE